MRQHYSERDMTDRKLRTRNEVYRTCTETTCAIIDKFFNHIFLICDKYLVAPWTDGTVPSLESLYITTKK